MEPRGPLHWSQKRNIQPYTKSVKYSLHIHTLSVTFILVLSTHLCLGPVSDLSPVIFLTEMLYMLCSLSRYMSRPSHPPQQARRLIGE